MFMAFRMFRKKSRFISRPGFRFRLVQPARLLEQQHAEAVEARVAQRQAILGFVHAEAAGSAGAGGEEDVAVDDFLLGQALLFQGLRKLHEVADGEVGGIALAVVAVFLAQLKRLLVGHRDRLAPVAKAFQRTMDQLLVLPGEAAEEDGGLIALGLGKGRSMGLWNCCTARFSRPASFSRRRLSSSSFWRISSSLDEI